ncbi:alkaline phosphatase family protein [Daejeonella sp.]|uniref:alkaline phosphatase family protein n=1 Tax=Daejeonella sp. TaxID=2805397 RepID=UPI0039838950
MKRIILTGLLFICVSISSAQNKTKNLVIVTLDGLRWQEVFRGADSLLVNLAEYNSDKKGITERFIRKSPAARRELLMPFFWSTVVQKGQIYGNRDLGNKAEVANTFRFSYPGYNELFTGFPDPRVNSNDKIPNPNTNLLEYVNQQKGFEGKVIAFTSWDVFPFILNDKRSGIIVNSGLTDLNIPGISERLKLLNEIQHQSPGFVAEEIRLDVLTYQFGKQYMIDKKPRVLYLGFDETDDLAHQGNYKMYLQQARKTDAILADLWNYLQSDPFYKDQTTLVITSDHGRGEMPLETWQSHGEKIEGAEQVWVAVMGPDTPAKGEIKTATTIYHKQLAQTISELLGLDFKSGAGHEAGAGINLK